MLGWQWELAWWQWWEPAWPGRKRVLHCSKKKKKKKVENRTDPHMRRRHEWGLHTPGLTPGPTKANMVSKKTGQKERVALLVSAK